MSTLLDKRTHGKTLKPTAVKAVSEMAQTATVRYQDGEVRIEALKAEILGIALKHRHVTLHPMRMEMIRANYEYARGLSPQVDVLFSKLAAVKGAQVALKARLDLLKKTLELQG